MKRVTRSVLMAFALCSSFVCFAEIVAFDSAKAGMAPTGWTVAMTHTGGAPKWEILRDDSAPSKPNVLAQTSMDSTGGRFPLAIYDRATVRDGIVSVKFKAVSGRVDQGAGLVWRYRDANNYYIVRANALENNVVLYKGVQNGERVSLAPKRGRIECVWHQTCSTAPSVEHAGRELSRQSLYREPRGRKAVRR